MFNTKNDAQTWLVNSGIFDMLPDLDAMPEIVEDLYRNATDSDSAESIVNAHIARAGK